MDFTEEERWDLYEEFLEEMFEEGLDDSDEAFEIWLKEYTQSKNDLETEMEKWLGKK